MPGAPSSQKKDRQNQIAPTHWPGLAHAQSRLRDYAVEASEKERLALQMSLFPDWPEERRGAPTNLIRSALFGVLERKRGKRRRITDEPIASPDKTTITATGWLLDQDDFDVWLEVMHLARNTKPGENIPFRLHWMLGRLGKPQEGIENFRRLKRRLKCLAETTISYDGPDFEGVAGPLLLAYQIDKRTGEVIVQTNPQMRPLFERVAWLQIEERRSLKSQLARWMHSALAAYPEWTPMRADTLMARARAEYGRVRDFKTALDAILADFKERAWITDYTINRGDDGLVKIDKVPTPAQARALALRNGGAEVRPKRQVSKAFLDSRH